MLAETNTTSVFEQGYNQHFARIRGYILSNVGNPDDADDIAQDVFLKAYEKRDTYKSEGDYIAWLFHIARNYMVSRHRYNSVRPASVSLDQLAECNSPLITSIQPEQLEIIAFTESVNKALAPLMPAYVQLLNQIGVEELTPSTIAEQTGRSENAVYIQLLRARRLFHKNLEANGITIQTVKTALQ